MKPHVFVFSLLALIATVLLGGCAGNAHRVLVDAINDPAATPALRTYTLTSGSKDLDPSTLQFREASALLRTALSSRGYVEAAQPGDAALRIALSYGIGRPETRTVTHSYPVYAELGGGRVRTVTKNTDAAGKTTTSSQTTIVPGRYERVGSDVTTSTYTLYPKHVIISARETQTLSGSTPEVWSVSASYQSHSADLRADLPVLIAAAKPYLGENTGHGITVKVIKDEAGFRIESAP
jgi:hypothetical protein